MVSLESATTHIPESLVVHSRKCIWQALGVGSSHCLICDLCDEVIVMIINP